MGRFQFSLEKVLRLRQNETLLAQQALAGAQREAAAAAVAVEQARHQRLAFEREMSASRGAVIKVGALSTQTWQHGNLALVEAAAVEALHEALAEVAARRFDLEEAERRQKALEKLQETQMEAFSYEELAREQAAIDEMAQSVMRGRKGADRS